MDYIAENKIIKSAGAKETKTGTRTVNIMFPLWLLQKLIAHKA